MVVEIHSDVLIDCKSTRAVRDGVNMARLPLGSVGGRVDSQQGCCVGREGVRCSSELRTNSLLAGDIAKSVDSKLLLTGLDMQSEVRLRQLGLTSGLHWTDAMLVSISSRSTEPDGCRAHGNWMHCPPAVTRVSAMPMAVLKQAFRERQQNYRLGRYGTRSKISIRYKALLAHHCDPGKHRHSSI